MSTAPPLSPAHSFTNAIAALHAGDAHGAEQILLEFVEEDPAHSQAELLLGQLLEQARDFAGAERHLRRAAELSPTEIGPYTGLARVLRYQGRPDDAAECIRQGLQIDSESSALHNALGSLLLHQGVVDQAIEQFSEALRIDPMFTVAHINLGVAARRVNETAKAARCFHRALEILSPESRQTRRPAFEAEAANAVRLHLATLFPIIAESEAAVEAASQRVCQALAELESEQFTCNPALEYFPCTFYLAYQNWNDREYQERIAAFCRPASVDYTAGRENSPSKDGKIRVGIISGRFRLHTVGLLWLGLIARLSREKFHVEIISLGDIEDEVTAYYRDRADHFLPLRGDTVDDCRRIAERQLDVLYFLDIGMDPRTYALANCRMAPVQCVTWGHPVTSGLDTIDYFISSELFEEASAQQHYTEELVRLKTTGLCYESLRLDLPHLTRADFGLPDDKHLYGCLQTLFKFDPAFDRLLAEILRRDPEGILVLLEGEYQNWHDTLMKRFHRSLLDVVDRVCLLPRQPLPKYSRLVSLMDVVLDPPQFGGGKTTLDAFDVGVPVVTLPSSCLKARLTAGFYKAMSLTDGIANDEEGYVNLAVRLGTQPAYREQLSQKIVSQRDRLFNDLSAVQEVEDFFTAAVRGGPQRARPSH